MSSAWSTTHQITAYPGENEPMHSYTLTEDSEQIGELWISLDNHQIMQVWTRPDRRREGIATHLLGIATADLGEVLHSPAAHRTPEGHGWAEAVGGPAIEDEDDDIEEDEDY